MVSGRWSEGPRWLLGSGNQLLAKWASAHDVTAGFHPRVQPRERERVRKMEARVFCDLTLKVISHHFLPYSLC